MSAVVVLLCLSVANLGLLIAILMEVRRDLPR